MCFCQASEVIEDLEQTVIHLKQQIQEAENRRQRQLRVSSSHFPHPSILAATSLEESSLCSFGWSGCSHCWLPSLLVGFTTNEITNTGTDIWLLYFAGPIHKDFISIDSHCITSLLIWVMLKVQIRFCCQLSMKINNQLLCHANQSVSENDPMYLRNSRSWSYYEQFISACYFREINICLHNPFINM